MSERTRLGGLGSSTVGSTKCLRAHATSTQRKQFISVKKKKKKRDLSVPILNLRCHFMTKKRKQVPNIRTKLYIFLFGENYCNKNILERNLPQDAQ